jgi:diguanylate cyclase (GGDEF)-like protein/PAS domain S-box-containing protein
MAMPAAATRSVVPRVLSVRVRLTALAFLGMLATAAVVGTQLLATANALFLRQATAELQRQNSASSLQIEDLTDRAAASLRITRHNPDFEHLYEIGPTDPAARAATLRDIGTQLLYLQKAFAIDEICLINAHGAEEARCVQGQLAKLEDLSTDESENNPAFAPTLALADDEVYRSTEPYLSPDTLRYVVAHATPVVLQDGQHVGVLHFEIPLIWFAARVRETSLAGASSFLLDREGSLLVPPLLHDASEPEWPPTWSVAHRADDPFPSVSAWGSPGFRTMGASLLPDTTATASFTDGGEDYQVVYQPVFAGHWILATVLPHSAIFASVSELLRQTILLVAPLLLVGLALMAWYASSLLGPLGQLARALQGVGSGDLDQHLGIDRDDEIGLLGRAFDRMSSELRASRGQQAQAEHGLRAKEARYRQMFEGNHAVQLLVDPASGSIVDANPSACLYYGRARADLLRMDISELNVASRAEVHNLLDKVVSRDRKEFFAQHRLASGEIRDVQVHSSPFVDGERALLYSIVHDVTERLRAETALRHQASHDALTELPNRALLYDRLEHAAGGGGDQRPFALLLLDLDRFKEVNDTLGHPAGDALLQEMGVRLSKTFGSADTVARLGGDEFAVLLVDADVTSASLIAARVVDIVSAPVLLDQHEVEVGVSIGIAIYPEHGKDALSLMQHADVAMYRAKRDRGGVAVFTLVQDQPSTVRLGFVAGLRRAISGDELTLHYQPKVDCHSGVPTGVEALVRWNHPERGLVPPDQFITLAEQTGLIKPLTRWVLDAAVRQWHAWQQAGLRIPIAVNLSAHDVQDVDLPELIAHLLADSGVPPSALRLEITETALVAEPWQALKILSRLCETGVRVAIDDFGTGYSSLAYLKELPIHEIKIDRTFVRDMTSHAKDLAIVRSTIALGHNLGLEVVAEGVEDQATFDVLRTMGCDVAQGFHISRPLAAPDLAQWWRDVGLGRDYQQAA